MPVGCARGQILPLFAMLLALLLMPVAALAIDGGLLISKQSSLEGTAQAAAEAGSQSIDVTALSRSGVFQLCVAPDGGPSCGNGVGSVQSVVQSVVQAGGIAGFGTCRVVGAPTLHAGQGSGCELTVRSGCGGHGLNRAVGVTVVLWRPARLAVLTAGPWADLTLRASATSWLAHGGGHGVAFEVPQC